MIKNIITYPTPPGVEYATALPIIPEGIPVLGGVGLIGVPLGQKLTKIQHIKICLHVV
jgi:hypothetical protein